MSIQQKYKKLTSFRKDQLKRFAMSDRKIADSPSMQASGLTQELVDYQLSLLNDYEINKLSDREFNERNEFKDKIAVEAMKVLIRIGAEDIRLRVSNGKEPYYEPDMAYYFEKSYSCNDGGISLAEDAYRIALSMLKVRENRKYDLI